MSRQYAKRSCRLFGRIASVSQIGNNQSEVGLRKASFLSTVSKATVSNALK